MAYDYSFLTVAYLPLGHLDHAPPPFELLKISYMAKNATLEKLPQFFERLGANVQENH